MMNFLKSDLRKKHVGNLMDRKNRAGYLFIAPFLFGMLFIFLPALAESFKYSLEFAAIKFNYVEQEYIGFENYVEAVTNDTDFLPMLYSAIRGTLVDLVVILFFSFFIANVLNQKFIGRGAARTIFFLPVLVATGIIAGADVNNMATSFFSSSSNTGESISTAFSGNVSSFFDLRSLLESANLNSTLTGVIIYAVDNTYSVVNSSGVQILIFISALQSIPSSLFEASKVEGATKWEEFWKITFPILTPMILVNIVYTIIDSFTNPKYEILQYILDNSFTHSRGIGYACAMSWMFFVIILLCLGIICGILSKRIQYLD
jgi:ABC-type sugar transport system permease subunit